MGTTLMTTLRTRRIDEVPCETYACCIFFWPVKRCTWIGLEIDGLVTNNEVLELNASLQHSPPHHTDGVVLALQCQTLDSVLGSLTCFLTKALMRVTLPR